jgi:hypothetical protein
MEKIEILKVLTKVYEATTPQEAQKKLFLAEKLSKFTLPCPMCFSSDYEGSPERSQFGENMHFSFETQSFFCEDCGNEYSADAILTELSEKIEEFSRNIEGFALLLPFLE